MRGGAWIRLGLRATAVVATSVVLACAGGTGPAGPKVPSAPSELAVEAYIYAFPLVVFDQERQMQVQALGANNRLSARTTTSTPFSHDVLAPSADTVSTTALLDLRNGPLVLSVPESGKRYTRIDLLDAYTNVFASLGQRTEGNGAANFAIVGPTWRGDVSGMKTIHAPTNYVLLHGQVAAEGERDVPAASGLMRQWSLTPASQFAAGQRNYAVERPPVADAGGSAAERVEAMKPAKYFEEAAKLLQSNPAAAADAPLLKKFPSIGIDWKYGRFNPGSSGPTSSPSRSPTRARASRRPSPPRSRRTAGPSARPGATTASTTSPALRPRAPGSDRRCARTASKPSREWTARTRRFRDARATCCISRRARHRRCRRSGR